MSDERIVLTFSYDDLMKEAQPGDSEERALERLFEKAEIDYQRDHPCPECGSHNTHFDILSYSGKTGKSIWEEWCDDCGWSKINE